MSVYVLLEFTDDEEAKEFVKAQMGERVQVIYPDDSHEAWEITSQVCGVWKKPSKFCKCLKRKGWTRGKKYGWWVCVTCGLVSSIKKISATEWELALGTNLLPKELAPIPFDDRLRGWTSDMQWNFLLTEEEANE